MFDVLTELFLNTYFLFDAIAGKLVGDAKTLFDKLYSVFLLPENLKDALFNKTQEDTVREIETYADYAQICRIQKLSTLTDCEGIPAELQEIVAVKGGSLKKIKQLGFEDYMVGTEAAVCKFVSDTAYMGVVPSLSILGFLQCEGIFVAQNEALGKKNLEKAAQWNSTESILLALAYCKNDRQKNIDRLNTVTHGTLYDSVCKKAQAAYGLENAKIIPENKLLQKAFNAAVLKPEMYAPQYARLIFSDVLGLKDKERALFSSHKEMLSETVDLPLKLTCGNLEIAANAFEELPVMREKERRRINSGIRNSDLRADSSYRPLCIVGDSDYVLKLYASAIGKAFPAAHIEKIDVADLCEYDFEPSKNHVFVRSCDEDRQNIYFLSFKGEIREGIFNIVKNFLQSEKRRKFRLQQPSALIDLSAILPICFCDKQNAKNLKPYCDVVTISPVSSAEKPSIITHILQSKAKQYKLTSVRMDETAQKLLTEYSVDRAENLVDRAVRSNRADGEVTVTAEMLKEFASGDWAKNKYGFGGAGNEGK